MFVRLAFAIAAHLEPEILIVDEVLAVGDLAFHRRAQQARDGEEAQAGDRDAQREHGQQRPRAVPGQVTPGLAGQRAHALPPVSPTIRPSRTDTIREACCARAWSCVT